MPIKFAYIENQDGQRHKIFRVKDGTLGLAPYTTKEGIPELNFMQ